MNNSTFVTLYRVEGGIEPNRSRTYLNCDETGKLMLSPMRTIYIGDMEHMTYFLLKRLGIENIESFNNESGKRNVRVIKMIVPYWYAYLLNKYAVKQFNSKSGSYPKLVDKTTPGNSYGIKKNWAKLLRECCMHVSIKKIESIQDVYSLFFEHDNNCKRSINYTEVIKILKMCEVSEEDIKDLKEIWKISEKGDVSL